MKRKSILLLLLLGAAGTLGAQEMVTLSGAPRPTTNIVRQYKEDQSIHYFEDTRGNHYFVLHFLGDVSTVIKAQFPSYCSVREFEVYKDAVYFCGVFEGTPNRGLVGFIKVDDLFSNNQPYTFGLVSMLTQDGDYTNAYLSSADRMDVYEDGAGLMHWAVVGTLEHNAEEGAEPRRTACDIWYDPSVVLYKWQGSLLYQKDDLYRPTDITCTDDYVAVAAVDDNVNYSRLLVFDKVPPFTANPTYGQSIRISDRRHDDNVLVERLMANDIAVAHYYSAKLAETGTAVHYLQDIGSFSPAPAAYSSAHLVYGTSSLPGVIRDLRYGKGEEKLLLLHDIDGPMWTVLASAVFEFWPYAGVPMPCAALGELSSLCTLLSVDGRLVADLPALGGQSLSPAEPLMSVLRSSPNCYTEGDISSVSRKTSFRFMQYDDALLEYKGVQYNVFSPNPSHESIDILCQ